MKFFISAILSVLSITMTSVVAFNPEEPHGNLKRAENGVVHIGDDGVQRSYTPDGHVVDARALSNSEIHALITRYHTEHPQYLHLRELYASVDGRSVSERDIWSPPLHIKPREFREAQTPAKRGVLHDIAAHFKDESTGSCSGSCSSDSSCSGGGNNCKCSFPSPRVDDMNGNCRLYGGSSPV